MKRMVWLLLLTAMAFAGTPFSVEAIEDVSSEFPGAPKLQSFSFAQWEGRWVFIGGRTAGYHSVGGGSAEFLQSDANKEVWVVDTTAKPAQAYHAPLKQLPDSMAIVRDQWGATASASVQDGASLYIAGGYGQASTGKWTTFPILSKVDLPKLIGSVMHGQLSPDAIQFTESPAVRSAGGGLLKLSDGNFYLAMGHVFEGNYTVFEGQTEHNTAAASQEYLNEIRKLEIGSKDKGLSVRLLETFRDENEFHRRDLNVTYTYGPQGLGLAAYGGVFTPDTQLNYSKPVYVFANAKATVDKSFDQHLNAYSCATLLLYDATSSTMYTTFFGGIGRYQWDAAKLQFVENQKVGTKSDATYLDGLQWSDQISTLAHHGSTTEEVVQPKPLPNYLGANAVFIPVPTLAVVAPGTDVLDLSKLQGKTFVGYIYGGIKSAPYQFPYTKTARPHSSGVAPTVTNGAILKVYVVKNP